MIKYVIALALTGCFFSYMFGTSTPASAAVEHGKSAFANRAAAIEAASNY